MLTLLHINKWIPKLTKIMTICKSHLLNLRSWDYSSSVILKMEKAKEQQIHLKGTGHSQPINLPMKQLNRKIDMLSEASEAPRFPSTPQKPQNVQPQISSKKGTTVFMFCPPSGSTVCVEKIDCALMGSTVCKQKKEMNRKNCRNSAVKKRREGSTNFENLTLFIFYSKQSLLELNRPESDWNREDIYALCYVIKWDG